jgi:hypothetical protein
MFSCGQWVSPNGSHARCSRFSGPLRRPTADRDRSHPSGPRPLPRSPAAPSSGPVRPDVECASRRGRDDPGNGRRTPHPQRWAVAAPAAKATANHSMLVRARIAPRGARCQSDPWSKSRRPPRRSPRLPSKSDIRVLVQWPAPANPLHRASASVASLLASKGS